MAISAYTPRQKTDAFFPLAGGSYTFTGVCLDAARWVTEQQLLDSSLWALFVNQFRSNVDDRDNGWRCEYWGKMMRGAAFTYAATGDQALYQEMERIVEELLTVQDSFGRFSTYSRQCEFHGWDMWGRKYILLGLQYFWEICEDEPLKARIVDAMCRHADYILTMIGEEADRKLPITRTSAIWLGMNSCSILEPMVRLHVMTGDKRYLDFAGYIVSTGFVDEGNLIELALEDKLDPYQYPVTKAYEMMSCFEGLLEYYRVTGKQECRRAVENFARRVRLSDITVIGSAGCTHELFDHSALAQTDMERNRTIYMQETCVTVTWMKLCHQLLCLTGDAVYAQEMERSYYNAMLGSLNTQKHRGALEKTVNIWPEGFPDVREIDPDTVFLPFDSYSPLLPNVRGKAIGGLRFMENHTYYGCCCAIGAAGIGLFPGAAAFRTRDGVSLCQYLPGTVSFPAPDGSTVSLTVDTAYPAEGTVRIRVGTDAPTAFALRLHIPQWSKKTSLTVCGTAEAAEAGAFSVLNRTWQDGDEIALTLDLRIRKVQQDGYASIARGPVVLARDARLGDDVEKAISVPTDDEGYVIASPTTVSIPCKQAFAIPQPDGSAVSVIDYPSAGTTWSEESKMAAWFSEK